MSSPIPHSWQVPDVFRERMGNEAGRQRIMVHAGHLLVILHAVPEAKRSDKREARLYWRSPDGKWLGSAGGSPGVAVLREHVDAYVVASARLEALVDAADSADDWFTLIREVAPLHRAARNMYRTLQEAREAVKDDKGLISVRDLAGDAERAFDLTHAHAQEGLDYTIARRAEEQSRDAQHMLEAAHRLNMIAAVFLPVTAVATLFSMNFSHGLEHAPAPHTFWVTAALCFMLGLWIKASMPRPAARPTPEERPAPRKATGKSGKAGGAKGR